MAFKITTATERMERPRGKKGVIVGPSGIGKTSLLWTLDPATTLFVNLEAGDLSVQGWAGDSVEGRTWDECRNLACLIGGPNPALRPDQPYSQAHYDFCVSESGGIDLSKYKTLFVDSITVASRLCFQWAKGQPQAFTEKGKPDTRGAYGLLGQEVIGWLTQWQHTPGLNVWLVGILDKKVDDYKVPYWSMQIEGSKAGLEIPGIVDQLISMVEMRPLDGPPYRAFVCHTMNEWGYPAKDRSGRLDLIEEPHLGKLMAKIDGPVQPAAERLTHAIPTETTPAP